MNMSVQVRRTGTSPRHCSDSLARSARRWPAWPSMSAPTPRSVGHCRTPRTASPWPQARSCLMPRAVQARAEEYAAEHGIDYGQPRCHRRRRNTNPTVRVVIDKVHDFVFMGIVGIEDADVGAVASAGKFSYGGGAGVVPWGIEEDTLLGAASGDEVTIKYDSSGAHARATSAPSASTATAQSDYENSAKYGSDYNVCSSACRTAPRHRALAPTPRPAPRLAGMRWPRVPAEDGKHDRSARATLSTSAWITRRRRATRSMRSSALSRRRSRATVDADLFAFDNRA